MLRSLTQLGGRSQPGLPCAEMDRLKPLVLWRLLAPAEFDARHRGALVDCLDRFTSVAESHRLAIRGDPAAAVSWAIAMRKTGAGPALDLAMSAVLRCAFADAGAAATLAHCIALSPKPIWGRSHLSESWSRFHDLTPGERAR